MRILAFIHHYHTPDCATAARPYSLIRRLSERHDVTLITTDAWRARRKSWRFEWVPPNVNLVEYQLPYRNEMGTARRLLAFAGFAGRSLFDALRADRPDVVFASSTPLSTGVAGALAARWHGVPWVFEVRDLWPDFPIQMGAVPSPTLQRMLYGLERWLYRDADHIIGLSPDMSDHIREHAPDTPVSTVLYGSDFDLVDSLNRSDVQSLRAAAGDQNELIVLYAGSFGRANAIPTLIQTARHLEDRSGIQFVFTGEGYHAPTVEKAAAEVPSITHLPPLPHHQALALFSAADVSIVSFADRPVLATNSPGKLFDSLAVGTPVVVTNPGWTARMVEEEGCGWAVPAEKPHALADMLFTLRDSPGIREDAARKAAAMARRSFRRCMATAAIEDILMDGINSNGS
ncbi:MAG: glycosyltransferase [Bacteroidetes bacterium]|jgi:glycosyltransferase involved in cell wall biosynthesis|nr:glycosyltransferase [Bacteroidota bacterium]